MHFNVSRRAAGTATTIKGCTLCGASLPIGAVSSLCDQCARPVRLGGLKPNVMSAQGRPVAPVGSR